MRYLHWGWFRWSSIAAIAGYVPSALAHHAMASGLPDTLISGLLSGFSHPVIGLDHLLFVVAVGLAAVRSKRQLTMPLVFVSATLVGCAALITGWEPPVTEWAISLSLIVLGSIFLLGKRQHAAVYWLLFTVAGWFHGAAYGESILGAEAMPLAAYLTGFAVIQYIIAVTIGALAHQLWKTHRQLTLKIRFAGAALLGVGAVYLTEQLESVLWL